GETCRQRTHAGGGGVELAFDHHVAGWNRAGAWAIWEISLRARLARRGAEAGAVPAARRRGAHALAEVGCVVFLHRDGSVLSPDAAGWGDDALSCGDRGILRLR